MGIKKNNDNKNNTSKPLINIILNDIAYKTASILEQQCRTVGTRRKTCSRYIYKTNNFSNALNKLSQY